MYVQQWKIWILQPWCEGKQNSEKSEFYNLDVKYTPQASKKSEAKLKTEAKLKLANVLSCVIFSQDKWCGFSYITDKYR